MKRKFKATPILASTANGKYYLVDDKGNRYYVDDILESVLYDCVVGCYMQEDLECTAYESVDCLDIWAFEDAAKDLGITGVEHLHVPKELEEEYINFAYELACERLRG